MKTLKLEAVLQSEVRIVSINRWRGTVTLDVDGQQVTLCAGDSYASTLTGNYWTSR